MPWLARTSSVTGWSRDLGDGPVFQLRAASAQRRGHQTDAPPCPSLQECARSALRPSPPLPPENGAPERRALFEAHVRWSKALLKPDHLDDGSLAQGAISIHCSRPGPLRARSPSPPRRGGRCSRGETGSVRRSTSLLPWSRRNRPVPRRPRPSLPCRGRS